MDLVGQVEGCDCILVDDMIDTAGTLCSAADELQAMGARSVYAYATHGCVCLALARRCCWIQARCCGWIEMLTRGRRAGCSTRRRSTASKTRCESEPSARLFHCPGAETWGARAVLGRSGGGKHDSAAGTRMASGGASCARVCVCPRPHSAPPAAQEEVQENTTKIQVLSVGPLLAEVRGPRRPCWPRRSPAHPARRRPSAGCTPASPSR